MSDFYFKAEGNELKLQTDRLSLEDKEQLKVLFNSQGWKLYRNLLMKMKEAHNLSILQDVNPNTILKTLGIIVGLNASINQLGVLMAQFKQSEAALSGNRETERSHP